MSSAPLETSPLFEKEPETGRARRRPITKAVVAVLVAATTLFLIISANVRSEKGHSTVAVVADETIKVAFMGNSIQYYQDLPRLLQHMLQTRFTTVVQDSCLQGGATLKTLFEEGNAMEDKFATPAAVRPDGTFDVGAPNVTILLTQEEEDWDYVLVNDFTQGPARLTSRTESKVALEQYYIPLLQGTNTTVVFLQTAAYEFPVIRDTEDLGDFDEFTRLTREGYEEYMEDMSRHNCASRLAPNGMAFSYVRSHKPDLFHKLYAQDHYHPSPHGSWLEACVVYCTIVGEMPPRYDMEWWKTSRYLQPGLPFPSNKEAEELRQVAGHICGLDEFRDSHH